MRLIEALQVKSKLFFLFILITLGLISVGLVGSMHLEAMKKNIDEVYFGSLIPITELNEIIQTYNNGLEHSIYKASRLEISPSQTALQIRSSIENIDKKWKSYESHFKRDDEQPYVDYTSLEIKRVNHYFLKIYLLANQGDDLSKLNVNTLEEKVSFIYGVIQKLINYEKDVARYERKKFLQSYEKTKTELIVALSIMIVAILFISLYIIKGIQSDQTRLEIATKKLKQANKKLENASYTDALTHLFNRRYFNLIYERELKRARRSNNYITFMMIDIDFFKQYNDTYGHMQGDIALQSVAKVLQERLKRPSDYVFRLGGEEFAVLLTETNESNSANLAQEIGDAIRAKEIKHENSKVNAFLTISIGVVCCIADDALDDEVLISRADEMLYKAKEEGRDRYIITSNVSTSVRS